MLSQPAARTIVLDHDHIYFPFLLSDISHWRYKDTHFAHFDLFEHSLRDNSFALVGQLSKPAALSFIVYLCPGSCATMDDPIRVTIHRFSPFIGTKINAPSSPDRMREGEKEKQMLKRQIRKHQGIPEVKTVQPLLMHAWPEIIYPPFSRAPVSCSNPSG